MCCMIYIGVVANAMAYDTLIEQILVNSWKKSKKLSNQMNMSIQSLSSLS